MVYAGIFAVPFVSLIVSQSMYFPFITGKNFTFRIIIEIIFGLWVFLAVADEKYRPKKSLIAWSFIAVLAAMTLATIFGEDSYRSFWSNYERMEGLIAYLHLGAFFLVIISMLSTVKLWRWFLHTSLVVNVMLGIYAIRQVFNTALISHSGFRVDTTFGNSTYFAIYLVFHIFIAAIFLFQIVRSSDTHYRKTKMLGYFCIVALSLFALYHTATRGAILGLIGGALLTALLLVIFERGAVRKLSISVLLATLILVGGFMLVRDSAFVKNSPILSRFAAISFTEQTTESRLMIWKMSFDGWKEKPVFGWGPENYNLVFNKYYNPELWRQEQWFDRAHNVIFDWLVQTGIVGLLAYLSLFFAGPWLVWKKSSGFSRLESSLIVGLLAAYFFQNIFVFDNLFSSVLFLSVLGYIHTRSTQTATPSTLNTPPRPRGLWNFPNQIKYTLASVVAVGILFTIYFANIKPIQASQLLIKALAPADHLAGTSLATFQKMISLNTFGSTEAKEQLLMLATNIRYVAEVPDQQKIEFLNYGKSEMDKQITLSPNNARYYLFMASFLRQFGQFEIALPYAVRGSELSPGKQSLYFELGNIYLDQRKFDLALAQFKTAFDLAPEFDDARIIYAAGAIYAKNTTLAKKLLEERYGTMVVSDERLIKAYADNGMLNLVVKIWQLRAEKNPNDAQTHLSLAAAYLAVGERQQTIAEIEKAIELNPEFKDQGNYYIKEIQAGRNP